MFDANDRTLLIKLQEYTHFGNNIIKILIKLYSTKTIFTKYVDYLQYLEFVNAENTCKNTRPQRRLQNFSPIQF